MELPAGAWGSKHFSGAVCLVLGAPYTAPRALHCSGALYTVPRGLCIAPGALYTTPRALCIALELSTLLPEPLHIVILQFLLKTAGAAEVAALSCPAARCPQQLLHHCHVAASVSISATATHCLCPRTHQHQPGPSRPSTDGLLLLQHPADPWGTLVTRVGDSGQALPTLTSSQGQAASLPAMEESGPELPRAISCCT